MEEELLKKHTVIFPFLLSRALWGIDESGKLQRQIICPNCEIIEYVRKDI